jgi:hypothetical protein
MKTESAKAAAAIKAELKKAFPAIKFSVKSHNYSGGDSVRISYNDAVPVEQIEAITDKYQYGNFNGMEDIYEYSNNRNDIPQSKYIFVDRTISEENKQIVKKEIEAKYRVSLDDQKECFNLFREWPDTVIYRETRQRTF